MSNEAVDIDGRTVRLTSLDKPFWPELGITKAHLIEYYRAVAPALLPHLRGRALTLTRFPEGVPAGGFYQSNCRGNPDWLQVVEIPSQKGPPLRQCVVNDEASLVWVANLGTVELHPFLWRVEDPAHPTALVFDLDPGAPATRLDCADVALKLRDVLLEWGLRSWVKTSGHRGLHVLVPLAAVHPWEEAKAFARERAQALEREWPERVVAKMARTARIGRVFIDWSQNTAGKSTIAPYSLRGTARPMASVPLSWEEVERAAGERDDAALQLGPADVLRRLDALGDLLAQVLTLPQTLPRLHG